MLHIARSEDWSRAKELGTYALPGGVVHCCSSSQLALVVAAHFPESAGHVVLLLDRERVRARHCERRLEHRSAPITPQRATGGHPLTARADHRRASFQRIEHPSHAFFGSRPCT